MSRILLIEDDLDLGSTISDQLEQEGFDIQWCKNLLEFSKVKASDYGLAIIDLNLPDGNGFQIVKSLPIPVVIMTALNTPENRLKGLELGAVEFIPKPFLFKELIIKINRLLNPVKDKIRLINGSEIDFLSRTIARPKDSTTVFLTDREFNILKLLFEKSPAVVSRDEILDFICRQDEAASHRSVDNSIVKIRQYLNDEDYSIIKSVRGIGYQWIGEKDE